MAQADLEGKERIDLRQEQEGTSQVPHWSIQGLHGKDQEEKREKGKEKVIGLDRTSDYLFHYSSKFILPFFFLHKQASN